jgi:hypothetical protein
MRPPVVRCVGASTILRLWQFGKFMRAGVVIVANACPIAESRRSG